MPGRTRQRGRRRTRFSSLVENVSSDEPTPLATLRSSSGSNRPESSSLSAMRATVMPSVAPGGLRLPPAVAVLTTSVRREVERER